MELGADMGTDSKSLETVTDTASDTQADSDTDTVNQRGTAMIDFGYRHIEPVKS